MIDLVCMTRHVARVETLAVVVVDVHASATAVILGRWCLGHEWRTT